MKLEYPILKNWSIFREPVVNPYQAPETGSVRLHGNVYGHERFNDGTPVSTSAVQTFCVEQDHVIARTLNTNYILGKDAVDPEYEAKYPNAYERLVKSIDQE